MSGPGTLFLDEPTSGLDPATSADVLHLLRRLADDGTTVVLTTHSTADAELCDTVVLLDRAGRVAFTGPPDAAAGWFGVTSLAEVFAVLASDTVSRPAQEPAAGSLAASGRPAGRGSSPGPAAPVPGHGRRSCSPGATPCLVRSPLTLAVLVGSPVLVTVMLAMLFRPDVGAGPRAGDGLAQVAFWTAFSGFFFGLTYGLLQIVPELAILRREHRAGLGAGAYVGAKMLVLLPVLALVTAVMLGVLRGLDRLPAAGLRATPRSSAPFSSRRRPPSPWDCSPRPLSPRRRKQRSPCRCCASPRSCSLARWFQSTTWRPADACSAWGWRTGTRSRRGGNPARRVHRHAAGRRRPAGTAGLA